MNMFNKIVQHTITIFKYHPPCRQMCPLHHRSINYTTNLCAWSLFQLKYITESGRLSQSLTHSCYGCTWNSKMACTINKKSAKLTINSQYPSPPHTYSNLLYKLNSGCCLLIDPLNVNKS